VDWPGAVNRYDKKGNLVNPGEAADGQNFLTFVALGYREVRSALLGLTLPQDDTAPEIQAGFFRAFRGFATAIKEEATSGAPMTQEQMTEAMRQLLASKISRAASFGLCQTGRRRRVRPRKLCSSKFLLGGIC
jgi:hypothetical protein